MVRAGAKPSLREASCCKVEVVKGAAGWRLAGLRLDARRPRTWRVSSALLKASRLGARADVEPVELLAVGADEPGGEGRAGLRLQMRRRSDQYSLRDEGSISSSRSQTSRSATDCTRPAERAPGSLRHSTGERVKPTR